MSDESKIYAEKSGAYENLFDLVLDEIKEIKAVGKSFETVYKKIEERLSEFEKRNNESHNRLHTELNLLSNSVVKDIEHLKTEQNNIKDSFDKYRKEEKEGFKRKDAWAKTLLVAAIGLMLAVAGSAARIYAKVYGVQGDQGKLESRINSIERYYIK